MTWNILKKNVILLKLRNLFLLKKVEKVKIDIIALKMKKLLKKK